MLLPVQFTRSGQVNTDNNPSPSIWGNFPWLEVESGELPGTTFWDNFTDYPLPGTQTSEVWLGRYKVYNTGAGKIITDAMPHSTTPLGTGGIISMLCDTDGDASVIGTQACPFSLLTTQSGFLCFEARIAVDSILTNMGQLFCGLAENSVATFGAATPLANADATASTLAMVGFNRLEDGLGVLNTSYADHAAAWTDIGTAANSTLAAQTWIKLGIVFDPKGDPLRCLRFFVDGVECTTAMTKAALLALTHLDAKGLGPCLAFFADSAGTADYTYLDWWRVGQVYA